MARGMAAGRHDGDAGQDLAFAIDPALRAPVLHERQFRLHVARHETRIVPQRDFPFGPLRHDPRVGEGAFAVGPQQAPRMVEMQVTHGDDVHARGQESRRLQGAGDPRTLVDTHRAGLFVGSLADTCLDEHPARGRFDEQTIEGLEQAPLVIDLVRDEPAPQDPGHRPEQCPGIGPERAGLDQCDTSATAEVTGPVDGVVHRHRITTPTASRSPVRLLRSRGGMRMPSVRTGPGTWSPVPATRTGVPPGWTS